MKQLILCLLPIAVFFGGGRALIHNPYDNDECQMALEEEVEWDPKTRFFYLSGGLTLPLPAVSVGLRQTYGSFASDLSISGPIPSAHYKQLFSLSRGWNKKFVPYLGAQIGVYVLGRSYKYLDAGGVTGLQINGSKLAQFIEFGVGTNILGVCGRTGWGMPTLSYGVLF